MKLKIWKVTAAIVLTAMLSCQNSDEPVDNGTTTLSNTEVVSDVVMDNIVDDVSTITEDQFGVQQSFSSKSTVTFKSLLPECAKITTELSQGKWTRIIDFGSLGCTLPNGNVLKGKIIITFANDFTSKEQVINFTFENFYHNDNKIEGSQSITRTLKTSALLAEIHPVTTLNLKLTITDAAGQTYERTGTRVREMVEGYATLGNWEDNVFLVWGSGKSKLKNGITISNTINDNPLRYVASCKLPFPTKGTIIHTKTSADNTVIKETKVDFGNGNCDKLATITIDGITKEIELKK